jgi:hypothetical protein
MHELHRHRSFADTLWLLSVQIVSPSKLDAQIRHRDAHRLPPLSRPDGEGFTGS